MLGRGNFFASAFSHNTQFKRASTILPIRSESISFLRHHTALFSSSPPDTQQQEEIKWTTDNVRSTFVSFFEKKEHSFVPSSACAPLNDPTLLFTNAGMNQYKPIFLGQVDPSSPLATLSRAVNSQKCIRAGGKHNDLDDVGRDTYHHTFFEMLGSWSFGDYFKEKAIDYAWELLVDVYGIDPERLYVTYFEGDESLGVEADLETKNFWLRYMPEDRIIASNAKENFWEMGETGPCGPCSELHYDRIGGRNAASLVNKDDPNVIEFWNLVFIQFNRDEKGLSVLPAQHIDTGMGLERLVSLLQDKPSNYDIDAFQPLFKAIEKMSKVGPYTGLVLEDDKTLKDTAYRAVADHARALTFSLADGAVPNNSGRGYVLRRILRRAARYGQQILKADRGFFVKLIPVVVETFGKAYPELVKNQENIIEIVKEEEEAFSSMLDRGISFFSELTVELNEKKQTTITGEKAFYLYDTVGFPIDLTEQMAEEAGFSVDTLGFEEEMESQKQRSRDARNAAKSGGAAQLVLIAEQTSWLADNGITTTNDSSKYELDIELPSTVEAIFTKDGFLKEGEQVESGANVGLILRETSFYAEAGGQESDSGNMLISTNDGVVSGSFTVTDVQSYGGYILHSGLLERGEIEVGSSVKANVDYETRRCVAPNHSMTHVMNTALQEVLGDSVEQRGSFCNDEKLRFDFSCKKALSLKQLRKVETICQKAICESVPVSSKVMPLKEAQSIEGVRAVFGEDYPDPVRVVSVGVDNSIEFCGGTHILNTAEAEAFAIIEETSVAKGIRRITAVTKGLALKAIEEGNSFKETVSESEKLSADTPDLDKIAGAIRKNLDSSDASAVAKAELRSRIESIQKTAVEERKRLLAQRVDKCLNVVKEQIKNALNEGKKSLVLEVDIGTDSKASQKVLKVAKTLAPEMALMGISEEEVGSGGKLMAFAIVPKSLTEIGFRADEWIRDTLVVCGGRGGGKPESAQGQAPKCKDLSAVREAADAFAEEKVDIVV